MLLLISPRWREGFSRAKEKLKNGTRRSLAPAGEILIYSKQVYIPQYRMNYYDYKMFYANKEGKIYRWLTKRENIPPTQIDLNVYRRY